MHKNLVKIRKTNALARRSADVTAYEAGNFGGRDLTDGQKESKLVTARSDVTNLKRKLGIFDN